MMKELSFDYDRDIFTHCIEDVDSKVLLEEIQEKYKRISEILECQVKNTYEYYQIDDIKENSFDYVISTEYTKNGEVLCQFKTYVPFVNNCQIIQNGIRKSVRRYIIDDVFILPTSRNDKLRVVSEFSTLVSLVPWKLSIKGSLTVPYTLVYAYFRDGDNSFDDKVLETSSKVDEKLFEEIEVNLRLNKEQAYAAISSSSGLKNRFFMTLRCLFELSDLLKSRYDHICLFLIDMLNYVNMYKNEKGLDLRSRRLKSIKEMIVYSCTEQVMNSLINRICFGRSFRKTFTTVQTFEYLYDFVVSETVFHAPLSTLSDICSCTIVGPGGYSRENVPVNVRNLHPSQFGCLDPVSTPDRENAGVILYLSSCCKLDKNGKFEIDEDFLRSVPYDI